jgi:hypothetical protein
MSNAKKLSAAEMKALLAAFRHVSNVVKAGENINSEGLVTVSWQTLASLARAGLLVKCDGYYQLTVAGAATVEGK